MLSSPAHAHKASDAYLQLQHADDVLSVRWDISLRDLDAVLDLDRNADGRLSWGEVRTRLPDIQAYAAARLRLQDGHCGLTESVPPSIEDRVDGAYLVLQLKARCEPAASLAVDYRLFREVDPTHRGLLRIATGEGQPVVARSLDPAAGPVQIEWVAGAAGVSADAPMARRAGFFQDGVHHILIGYDHVLFLLCLLLPAVLRRKPGGGWEPAARWQDAAWPILGLVTMFTLAHSITLALASLKVVSISPDLIEPAIAFTIMVAAVDNLYPVLRGRRKLFAFLFGLIHGFGFAGVLGELDLPVVGFVSALVQFNLGVEAGQLVIVVAALVLLASLRRWKGYVPVMLRGGSMIAVAIAGVWFVERVFDLKLMPI